LAVSDSRMTFADAAKAPSEAVQECFGSSRSRMSAPGPRTDSALL